MATGNWGSNDVNGTSFLVNPDNVARVASVAGNANRARLGFLGGSKPEITVGLTPAATAVNLNALLDPGADDFLAFALVGGGTLYVKETSFAGAVVDAADPLNASYLWTIEGPEIRWHVALNLTEITQTFFPPDP